MKKQIRKVLVVNSGSSSLKYQLFDMKTETRLAKGLVERIGMDKPKLIYQRGNEDKLEEMLTITNHAEALRAVMGCRPCHGNFVKRGAEIE